MTGMDAWYIVAPILSKYIPDDKRLASYETMIEAYVMVYEALKRYEALKKYDYPKKEGGK